MVSKHGNCSNIGSWCFSWELQLMLSFQNVTASQSFRSTKRYNVLGIFIIEICGKTGSRREKALELFQGRLECV